MKTKILSLFLFDILLFLGGCSNTEENENTDISSLIDTKWKLTGFVDATGTIKTPESDRVDCYWIYFDTDSTFRGNSSTNFLLGSYEIDYHLSTIQINNLGGTKINELFDGILFIESLLSVQSFSIIDKELKLYYGEQGDFLLFEPLQESTVDIKLNGTEWKLAGILNVETGELKILEPHIINCKSCYTLTFFTDTTALGRSCGNEIYATTKKTAAGFYMKCLTEAGDPGDCGLFSQVLLPLVDDCFFEGNQLIFAYTRDKVRYHLVYKLLES